MKTLETMKLYHDAEIDGFGNLVKWGNVEGDNFYITFRIVNGDTTDFDFQDDENSFHFGGYKPKIDWDYKVNGKTLMEISDWIEHEVAA